jgi:hypothetical protein
VAKFTLEINLDVDPNDRHPDRISRYLRDVASHVQAGHGNDRIYNLNGNTIGAYDITDE